MKSNPRLKTIYYKYYTQKTKEFIQIIQENKENSDKEIEQILIETVVKAGESSVEQNKLNELARSQTSMYNNIMNGVVNGWK